MVSALRRGGQVLPDLLQQGPQLGEFFIGQPGGGDTGGCGLPRPPGRRLRAGGRPFLKRKKTAGEFN